MSYDDLARIQRLRIEKDRLQARLDVCHDVGDLMAARIRELGTPGAFAFYNAWHAARDWDGVPTTKVLTRIHRTKGTMP